MKDSVKVAEPVDVAFRRFSRFSRFSPILIRQGEPTFSQFFKNLGQIAVDTSRDAIFRAFNG